MYMVVLQVALWTFGQLVENTGYVCVCVCVLCVCVVCVCVVCVCCVCVCCVCVVCVCVVCVTYICIQYMYSRYTLFLFSSYVIDPYNEYPNLLDVLFNFLKTEQTQGIRREVGVACVQYIHKLLY